MLTGAQEAILLSIAAHAQPNTPLPFHYIARHAHCHVQTVKEGVARLRALGLICVTQNCARGPGAKYCFTVTDKGQAYIEALEFIGRLPELYPLA